MPVFLSLDPGIFPFNSCRGWGGVYIRNFLRKFPKRREAPLRAQVREKAGWCECEDLLEKTDGQAPFDLRAKRDIGPKAYGAVAELPKGFGGSFFRRRISGAILRVK